MKNADPFIAPLLLTEEVGTHPSLQASISLAVNEEMEKHHMLGPSGSAFQQRLGRYQRAGLTRQPVSVYTD